MNIEVQKGKWISAILLGSALVISGCGKSGDGLKLVKNVQIKTFEQDGDAWAEMIATLDTGNIQLPAIDFPIGNPKNPGEQIGNVSIKPVISGSGNDLGLSVNLTKALKDAMPSDGNLPNGVAIPVGGLGGSTLIGLPIGNSGSKVYLALGPQTAVLGAAVVIKEFDKLGKTVGGLLNIFPTFKFGNNIKGVAGIFTSASPSQSGIAVFADASSVLGATKMQSLMASTGRAASTLRVSSASVEVSEKAYFVAQTPSKSKREKLYNELYRMHKAKARVSVK